MNKKQKIIVSVVGITIVLLALLGLTYAYFLTRIQGNTNEKSISVTTADLKLVYDDGSDGVVGGENLLPSDTVYTKTFTVKNEGNANVEYGVYLIDVINTFERLDDVKYTLNCTTDGTITCNEVTTETTFPNGIKQLITNEIEPGITHTYTFKFTYKDTNTDQSVDMGKQLQAKLQIFGKNSNGEFMPYEQTSLAYSIINNAKLAKNGTTFRMIPLTTPAQQTSSKYYTDRVDEAISESSVSITTTYQGYYWTYGTGYTIDESTGKFTLTGVSTCKYNDGTCNTTLVGKYLVSSSASSNSSSTNTQKTTTNLSSIYKVTTAPASSTSSITMKAKRVSAVSYSAEATLSATTDDYGTTYYYRGSTKDNYIEFNNMCWRIVRIEGDGSIKIILAKEGLCSTITSSDTKSALINNGATIAYGYKSGKYGSLADYENYSGGLYSTLKAWYTSSGLENKKSLLKKEKWCLGGNENYRYNDSTGALLSDTDIEQMNTNDGYVHYNYAAGKRLWGKGVEKNATLKCSSEEDSISDYIGTITADEVAYAGGQAGYSNKFYYLYDNAQSYYWSLSRSLFGGYVVAFYVDDDGVLDNYDVFNDDNFGARPAVTLATSAQIVSGDGTIENPYKILEN